ncbi:MAG: thymidylate synthase, partial [Candidatus Thermoplasmatota archaeon]
SLGRAHELAVGLILRNGVERKTENNELTLELDQMNIEVATPFASPMRSPHARGGDAMFFEYANQILKGTSAIFEYDYHSRLFDWNGDVNQIAAIIEKLRDHPESRRAMGITWIPPIDVKRNDVPCLQFVQCVMRYGKMDMHVVFRSNDMLSAGGHNMYGLVNLQRHITDEIGVPVGTYYHTSIVPHVYYLRDIVEVAQMCRGCRASGVPFEPQKSVCELCMGCENANV